MMVKKAPGTWIAKITLGGLPPFLFSAEVEQ
jgi:hypothetical protein